MVRLDGLRGLQEGMFTKSPDFKGSSRQRSIKKVQPVTMFEHYATHIYTYTYHATGANNGGASLFLKTG